MSLLLLLEDFNVLMLTACKFIECHLNVGDNFEQLVIGSEKMTLMWRKIKKCIFLHTAKVTTVLLYFAVCFRRIASAVAKRDNSV